MDEILVDGCIPKDKNCPWKDECSWPCRREQNMDKAFSCAMARMFEMSEARKK